MNRIDRLHAILMVLQGKRVVKAEDLSTRFNISKRTVYRDIRALEAGGVPIGAEAGVGYFLLEGYHLPPVMFTKEEARSLLIAGKLLEKNTDLSVSKNFSDAMTKIRAVLDTAKKDELESLEEKILISPFPIEKRTEDNLNLGLINEALAENKVISIKYVSADQVYSEREIEPLGLAFYYEQWHLISYCRLRSNYRDFRLDRIKGINFLNSTFQRIKHPTLKEYLDQLIRDTKLTSVKLNIHKSLLPYIASSKFKMGWLNEEDLGDYYHMEFGTISIEYFAHWIMMLGPGAEILEPKSLDLRVKKLIEIMAEKYNINSNKNKKGPSKDSEKKVSS